MISLALDPATIQTPGRHHYRIAGQFLVTDQVLASLVAFAAEAPIAGNSGGTFIHTEELTGQLTFHGTAWLGGEERAVECRQGPGGYEIRIASGLVWRVAPDGSVISRVAAAEPVSQALIDETAIGPPLILALALRGVFCLHASAVVGPQGAWAFLGVSGSGKSTLGAALDGLPGPDPESGGTLSRLADDILPVAVEAAGAVVLPWFPQLKLPAGAQPSLAGPERLPLRGFYVLAGRDGGEGVESQRLGPAEAVAGLVRHTVASRLFGPELLGRHLDFAGELAAWLPVRRLAYPWGRDIWGELVARMVADLA